MEPRRLLAVAVDVIPIPPGGHIISTRSITSAGDGNLWFVGYSDNDIIEYDLTSQTFSTVPLPTPDSHPGQITTTSDGNVWFTEPGAHKIGVIDVATHALTEVPVGSVTDGITTGPDGALWFTTSDNQFSMFGRLDPTTHNVTEFSAGARFGGSGAGPSLVAGPGGNLWFFGNDPDTGGPELCSFNVATHQANQYPLTGQPLLGNITTTPDGRVWFAQMDLSSEVDSVGVWGPATKTISYIALPTANATVMAIGVGPDGDVWFGDRNQDIVGQINSTTEAVTEYPFDGGDGREAGYMAAGSDGNLYFTTPGAEELGRITVPAAPGAPALDPFSDTGASPTDGITRNDGSAAAPLAFDLPASANGSFVRLYDVTDPLAPALLSGPVQDNGDPLVVNDQSYAEGTYRFAYILSDTPDGPQSATSVPVTVAIEKSLVVQSASPSSSFVTSLPDGQIRVTFDHRLAGLTADDPSGGGFKDAPFAVMLIPSGPDGAATQAQTGAYWSAPNGVDDGDLPVPATAVYHVNADGTSTITLTPDQPPTTDVYLISVSGLVDPAGNALAGAGGAPGPFYAAFDFRPPSSSSGPHVVAVTADQGAIVVDNDRIPQPDTIGIRFDKPMDTYTINEHTVQLFAQGVAAPLRAAVAYSPSTQTAYLTPEEALTPGTVYYVAVGGSVTDDQGFPSPGVPLGASFSTSFTVDGPGPQSAGAMTPLTIVRTDPLNGTRWTSPLGYGAVTFNKAVDMSSLGRFSAMLVPQTGGVTTGGSGYADVPLNAKVAFNPNTNQLVIVPTGALRDGTVYLFSLSGMNATDGTALAGTIYSTFELNTAAAQAHSTLGARPSAVDVVALPATSGVVSTQAADPAADRRTTGSRGRSPSLSGQPRRAVPMRLVPARVSFAARFTQSKTRPHSPGSPGEP